VYKKESFPRFLSEIYGLSRSPIEAFGEKVNAACGREAALGYDGLEGILKNIMKHSFFKALSALSVVLIPTPDLT